MLILPSLTRNILETHDLTARWDMIKTLDAALAVPSWATSQYELAIDSMNLVSAKAGECLADLAKSWVNERLDAK